MSWSRSLAPLRRYGAHPDHLADQVEKLSAQVAKFAKSVGHDAQSLGRDASHSAGEFAGDLIEQLTPLAHRIGKQARLTGRQIQADPAPAVIALGTFALIATLVLARR